MLLNIEPLDIERLVNLGSQPNGAIIQELGQNRQLSWHEQISDKDDDVDIIYEDDEEMVDSKIRDGDE